MLKTVILKNWQNHKDLKLDFHEHFNVIVGSSDSGKSAILRAINWVLTNRPTIGIDGFKNWNSTDEESMSVELEFDNGKILRERGRDKNLYKVNGKKLDTINRDLPFEVPALSNMNYINFQKQSDTYFLLNDTPGEVANKLSDIVGLSIIGATLKKLSSYISEAKKKKESLEEEVDEIEKNLKKFPSPREMKTIKKQLKELENAEKKLNENEQKIENISISLDRLSEYRNLLEEGSFYISLEKLGIDIDSLTENIEKTEEKLFSLSDSINKINKLKIKERELLKTTSLEKLSKDIFALNFEIEKNTMSISYLRKSLEKKAKFDVREGGLRNTIDNLLKEYSELLKRAKICPTCFTEINEKSSKRIIDNLGGNV